MTSLAQGQARSRHADRTLQASFRGFWRELATQTFAWDQPVRRHPSTKSASRSCAHATQRGSSRPRQTVPSLRRTSTVRMTGTRRKIHGTPVPEEDTKAVMSSALRLGRRQHQPHHSRWRRICGPMEDPICRLRRESLRKFNESRAFQSSPRAFLGPFLGDLVRLTTTASAWSRAYAPPRTTRDSSGARRHPNPQKVASFASAGHADTPGGTTMAQCAAIVELDLLPRANQRRSLQSTLQQSRERHMGHISQSRRQHQQQQSAALTSPGQPSRGMDESVRSHQPVEREIIL